MISQTIQCDFCLSHIPVEYITNGEYPKPKSIIYMSYYDSTGKHICNSCFKKIREYDRSEWLKTCDTND